MEDMMNCASGLSEVCHLSKQAIAEVIWNVIAHDFSSLCIRRNYHRKTTFARDFIDERNEIVMISKSNNSRI